jgi:hypothetical protein
MISDFGDMLVEAIAVEFLERPGDREMDTLPPRNDDQPIGHVPDQWVSEPIHMSVGCEEVVVDAFVQRRQALLLIHA